MAKKDLSLDSLTDLLHRQKETESEDHRDRESRNMIEINKMLTELQSLQDQQAQSIKIITKNLKTIVTQKHALQKRVEDSENEATKLPITHKHQLEAINFVSDAINLINNFPEIQKSVEPENDIDTNKLCQEINTCGESVNQELSRSKTRVNQVETLRENMEIIKNQCFVPCDDDQDLME